MDASWSTGGNSELTCLGLRLKPLSLGHVFLLLEHESPYLSNQPVTCADLMLAAFICSDRYDESINNLKSSWRKFVFWLLSKRRWDWQHEQIVFETYLMTGLSLPEVRTSEANQTISAPWPYILLAKLMSEFSLTHNEVMTLSLAHLNRIQIAHSMRKGELKTWTEENQGLWEYARQEDSKKGLN